MIFSGIPVTNNVFQMNHFATMSHHALVGWLLDAATKQEKHRYWLAGDAPNWAVGPARFREHAAALSQKEEAAKDKGIQAIRDRDLELEAIFESIHNNAAFFIMKARYENDPSALEGIGHQFKDNTKKPHLHVPISSLPLKVTVKRGDEPGSIVVTIERDPGAGIYQVQICKGKPTGEESWLDHGNFKKVRVTIPGLERAGWYYIRVRSIGDNEASPWSAPVDIIVG